MSPEVGNISLVKLLKVVVLPAPLTPSKAKHSPNSKLNEVFSTANQCFPMPVL